MARTSTSTKKAPPKATVTKKAPVKATNAAKEPVKRSRKAPAPKPPEDMSPNLTDAQRLVALEQRVEVLESERPGRKPRPLVAIRQKGVCALDPSRDSKTCPDASIYRYQSGCHGDACRLRQHEAYEARKSKTNPRTKAQPVKSVSKRVVKAPSKTPTKRVSKSVAA